MSQLRRSLFSVTIIFLFVNHGHADTWIYESATNLIPDGVPSIGSGTGAGAGTISGVIFELDVAVSTTAIGGHFYNNDPDPPLGTAQTIFAAVVALEDENSIPDLDNNTLGHAILDTPGLMHAEVEAPLEINLSPGWYALAYGSDRFGVGPSHVLAIRDADGQPVNSGTTNTFAFSDSFSNFEVAPGIRFFLRGNTVVPEPASGLPVCLFLTSFVLRRRR